MKFIVNITGDFTNIKGLVISQTYYLNIQCGACNTLHKKTVFISDKDKKKVEVKEIKGKIETFNLTVQEKLR